MRSVRFSNKMNENKTNLFNVCKIHVIDNHKEGANLRYSLTAWSKSQEKSKGK